MTDQKLRKIPRLGTTAV